MRLDIKGTNSPDDAWYIPLNSSTTDEDSVDDIEKNDNDTEQFSEFIKTENLEKFNKDFNEKASWSLKEKFL